MISNHREALFKLGAMILLFYSFLFTFLHCIDFTNVAKFFSSVPKTCTRELKPQRIVRLVMMKAIYTMMIWVMEQEL